MSVTSDNAAEARRGKRTLNTPLLRLVRGADPDREREKRNEIEYRFSNGNVRTADPAKRGAYADD